MRCGGAATVEPTYTRPVCHGGWAAAAVVHALVSLTAQEHASLVRRLRAALREKDGELADVLRLCEVLWDEYCGVLFAAQCRCDAVPLRTPGFARSRMRLKAEVLGSASLGRMRLPWPIRV